MASRGNRALVARAKALPMVRLSNHSYGHANTATRTIVSTEAVVADMLRSDKVLDLSPPVDARMPGRDVFRLPNISKDDLA